MEFPTFQGPSFLHTGAITDEFVEKFIRKGTNQTYLWLQLKIRVNGDNTTFQIIQQQINKRLKELKITKLDKITNDHLSKEDDPAIFGDELKFTTVPTKKIDLFKYQPSKILPETLSSLRKNSDDLNKKGILYFITKERNILVNTIHHGVSCNNCGMSPIAGPRYYCATCADYDLCETCETSGVHPNFHDRIKINIPIPLMKSPRFQWKPSIPIRALVRKFDAPPKLDVITSFNIAQRLHVSSIYVSEMYKYYEPTFNNEHPLGMTKSAFLELNSSLNCGQVFESALFRLYDQDNDGIVSFEEFITVEVCFRNETKSSTLRRAIKALDWRQRGYFVFNDIIEIYRGVFVYWAKTYPYREKESTDMRQMEHIWESSKPLGAELNGDFYNTLFLATTPYQNDVVFDRIKSNYLRLKIASDLRPNILSRIGLRVSEMVFGDSSPNLVFLKEAVRNLFYNMGWSLNQKVYLDKLTEAQYQTLLNPFGYKLLTLWCQLNIRIIHPDDHIAFLDNSATS